MVLACHNIEKSMIIISTDSILLILIVKTVLVGFKYLNSWCLTEFETERR